MGAEAGCIIRVDGKSARGTAWLEQKDLIFRGPFRFAIPFTEIRNARAEGGTLVVTYGRGVAELDIGDAARKWADRITNPPSRLDKLGVKPGSRVTLIGVADPAFRGELEARGALVTTRGRPGGADILFYAAETRAALDRLGTLKDAIAPDGAVWVIRPKGQKAITEADTMKAGKDAGLVDVKVVSFSEALTAEKFMIPVAKRAAPRRSASPRPRTRGSASSRDRT